MSKTVFNLNNQFNQIPCYQDFSASKIFIHHVRNILHKQLINVSITFWFDIHLIIFYFLNHKIIQIPEKVEMKPSRHGRWATMPTRLNPSDSQVRDTFQLSEFFIGDAFSFLRASVIDDSPIPWKSHRRYNCQSLHEVHIINYIWNCQFAEGDIILYYIDY